MTTTTQLGPAFTAPGQNAHNAPMLNVLGMPVGVKLQHAQTGGQFSCVETHMAPFQFGPPPHVHYELDEIMLVLDGTITVLEGDQPREIPTGGYHFRPRGVVHTFWNAHGEPARFLDMYPGTQDFAHYLEELSELGAALHAEGANPFASESLVRFKALDARYNHEVFYEQMPEHMAKYGPKG
ncbi:cupin domain-containing protein [Spirosoma aerophilum]